MEKTIIIVNEKVVTKRTADLNFFEVNVYMKLYILGDKSDLFISVKYCINLV